MNGLSGLTLRAIYAPNTELNLIFGRSGKLIFECIIIILGIYPEPYIFIRSESEIKAVDLLTHDATVVIRKLKNSRGLVVHIKDKKLYFGDDNQSISRANLDGSGREVILKNVKIYKMAIDWIGRRIFWTKFPYEKRIFVMNMEEKQGRTFLSTEQGKHGIAVDALAG